MQRTCQKPTPWSKIVPGCRVRFQTEALPAEVTDVIVAKTELTAITASGRELVPVDYIVVTGRALPGECRLPRRHR